MRFNGQALATGTGFVVDSSSGPALITNRHNVLKEKADFVALPLKQINGVQTYPYNPAQPRVAGYCVS